MKKRIFTFLSIFIIATFLLAGCASQPTQAPAAPAVPVATAQPTAVQPVDITFMAWGAPEELAVWQKLADDFHAINPNITVKMDVSDWDSYWTKLDTLFAGGTPPDVFAMDAPMYKDWQSKGVLLNLQPYIDKTPGFLDGLYPEPLKGYKMEDGYYGLPRDFQTIVMFYNKDMFDKAGVPYPKQGYTWNDLREMAKKLTIVNSEGKVDQYGFSCDLWDMEICWSEAIWSNGGDVISSDYIKTMVGEPKAREAWQMFHDMIFVDKSMPDTVAAQELGSDLFQAGKVALWPMGHWAIPGYSTVNFQWDVAPMPTGAAAQVTSVNSAGFVAAKDSKHPDAAWEFIKYALSEKGQTRLTEMGLAIPMQKSVAESPAFLNQKPGGRTINQQLFLDSVVFSHMKPIFKGYSLWADAVGNTVAPIWSGEAELNATLDKAVQAADAVLAEQK